MAAPAGFDTMLAALAADFSALPDKPEETPESTLRALWALAMGQPASAETALNLTLRDLGEAELAMLRGYLARWDAGEPLAHITGRQQFMGIELLAGPEALVPRKETEILARAAITKIRDLGSPQPIIIDVCTGCGNLPLAYAHAFPEAQVFAADLSEAAVALARNNAEFTGHQSQVEFAAGDLLVPFDAPRWLDQVDVLTCNPPYISSKKVGDMAEEISRHEPAMAFDGGPFGISILQRLLKEAPRFLKAGGWLLFEVGLGQGASMAKVVNRTGAFDTVETHLDEAGEIRVIAARKAQ